MFVLSFFFIYTFPLAQNKIVYTPSQGKNREKYFNPANYKGENEDIGGR